VLFLLGAALTGCEAVGDTDPPSGLGLCEASLSCLVDIESDRAVTLATLMLDPETSAPAVVILLEGGDGLLTFTGPDTAPVVDSNGFLARNAVAFAAQGLAVALVNTPSDRPTGIDLTCRISADQSQDIDAVVQWVRGRTSVPVWVMGMSLGSYSATNTAIRLINPVDGFALCSASTAPTGPTVPLPNGVLDMDLTQIAMPAVVVGHEDDTCAGTPPSGAAAIVTALTEADPVDYRLFGGGLEPDSDPCGPLSPHGYYGVEDEVVRYLAEVITR